MTETSHNVNSMEILKHIGTALVAMIPLGTAYMNLKENVLTNSIEIKYMKEEIKTAGDRLNLLKIKVSELKSADSVIKSDLDSSISTTSQNLRTIKQKIQALERTKR